MRNSTLGKTTLNPLKLKQQLASVQELSFSGVCLTHQKVTSKPGVLWDDQCSWRKVFLLRPSSAGVPCLPVTIQDIAHPMQSNIPKAPV